MVEKSVLNAAPENELIRNTMKKADLLLNSYKNPVCSVSGGSDSDDFRAAYCDCCGAKMDGGADND